MSEIAAVIIVASVIGSLFVWLVVALLRRIERLELRLMEQTTRAAMATISLDAANQALKQARDNEARRRRLDEMQERGADVAVEELLAGLTLEERVQHEVPKKPARRRKKSVWERLRKPEI